MDTITLRQMDILDKLVGEYIKRAFPISSGFLKERGGFECSSATLRNDLAELAEMGFLEKAYLSSGSVPTDKGFRFFVDEILGVGNQAGERKQKSFVDFFEEIFVRANQEAQAFYQIAEGLSRLSGNLGFVCQESHGVLWKEGWENILREPEFADTDYLKSFALFVEDFEKNLYNINSEEKGKVVVFIGKECPFKSKSFSLVLGKPDGGIVFAILGPKRMDFQKNIALIRGLVESFQGSDLS